jgi:hypothetical protein
MRIKIAEYEFTLGDLVMGLVAMLLFLSIPFGIVMALVTNENSWFWFCLPILIFLS